jgi:hypothetical protein
MLIVGPSSNESGHVSGGWVATKMAAASAGEGGGLRLVQVTMKPMMVQRGFTFPPVVQTQQASYY